MCTQPDDCYCTTHTCFVVSSELTASVYGQISEHQREKKDWNAGECYQGRPEILLTSWGYGEGICSCTQKNKILGLHKHESMILNKMQLKYWKR